MITTTSAQRMTVNGNVAIEAARARVASLRAELSSDPSGNTAEALMVAEEILASEVETEGHRQTYRDLTDMAARRGITAQDFNARVRARMMERLGYAGDAKSWTAYAARELGVKL